MTDKEKLILEGLEERYGTDAVANAVLAMNNAALQKNEDMEGVVVVISPKEAVLNYIKFLEGCHTRIKEIHWSADRKSKHELADDIRAALVDYEDSIAEDAMGYIGTRIKVFDVVPVLPKSTDLKSLIDEIEDVTLNFLASIEGERKCVGIVNILEEIEHSINKWKYLETLQ